MSENTEIKTSIKKTRNLPIPLSKKAKDNLIDLQERYMKKYGKFINVKKLGRMIFEKATPEIL